MAWYINDISLAGQYGVPTAFLADLRLLLEARSQLPALTASLYCSRSLHLRPVSFGHNFQQAVRNGADKAFTGLVLNWLTKAGPFWEDTRQDVPDDYFECHTVDVTDQGLGEAARRRLSGNQANTFSFSGAGFDYSPLEIQHGLPEAPINVLLIANQWQVPELRRVIEASTPAPVNWSQMLDQARTRYKDLDLVDLCTEPLKAEPFSRYVTERVFELLGILDEYVACFNTAGILTSRNYELLSQHFSGKKAWFSDESETNKREFERELSFVDPRQPGTKIFCPWHGKIKTPQYRVHFEWPPKCGTRLRVFYIGPKITKT